MRTFFARALLAAFFATLLPASFTSAASQPPVRRGSAVDPAFKPPPITVADGYIVEVAAGPPLIKRPMMAGFDDRGRLFVAEAAGLNLKSTELDEQQPNFMTRLEDTDGDGFFDKSTLFADKMTFPQGALWLDGALYVSSPPGLWRFEDTDGDGRADKRTQLATGFAYTGNAADVHGPFLGPTGRLFWCHGRKGHEVHQHDGTLVSQAKGARIWSCKPDGSDIQVFAGGGMDNPVEVDFTEEGDLLGTVNLFHGRPRGDTLVHWLYGGAYPRHDQEAVVAEFKRTGDLLPEVFNYGHVAVSGMTRYRSAAFGPDFRDNLFVTFFNTQKVTRSILAREGSTYRCRNVDFFYADSTDVHVTDVLEDADGSLLVIDTGGWFRIGCPTSQVAKPDVYGAIYRVRKAGTKTPADPRGLKIDWPKAPAKQLVRLLDDERFAVRDRAIAVLAKRGDAVVADLRNALKDPIARLRRNAVWTLARIGTAKALAALRLALPDQDAGVRQAACHSAGVLQDPSMALCLMIALQQGTPAVQREAATALGRIGATQAIPSILALLERPLDRPLEHALIYALIQLNRPASVLPGLAGANPELRRRALIALDQMNEQRLTAAAVLPLLDAADEPLRAAAIDVVARRADWADDTATWLGKWLDEGRVEAGRQQAMAGVLPKLLAGGHAEALMGRMLGLWKSNPALCRLALAAIAQSGQTKLPDSWRQPIEESLGCDNRDLAADSIGAVAALKTDRFDPQLRALSADPALPALIRIKALGAMAARAGTLEDAAYDLLAQQLSPNSPGEARTEASHLFSTAKLTKAQLLGVARMVGSVGPLELPVLLGAFNKSRDREVGLALVSVLTNCTAVASLKPADLQKMLQRYPADVYQLAKPMVDELVAQAEQQTARLLKMDAELAIGDAEQGKAVFYSEKAVCSVCHRVGEKGGQVGPDLTRIGRIRTQRDLLEAILYPSASLARDFEPFTINTKDGESQSGVIQRETSDAVFLALATGAVERIPRDTIRSIVAGQLSVMPQGLENAVSREQLANLVAFLRSLK